MMRLFVGFMSAAFLVMAGVSQASAASITEEFTVFYTNTTSSAFSLNNLFFGISGESNLITGNTNFSSLAPGVHVTLLSEQLVLDTSQSYTFSGVAGGSSFSRGVSIPQSVGVVNFSNDGLNFTLIAESMSPVPLPASLPLFALALICLGAWAFHEGRRKQKILPSSIASASFQSQ